MVGLLINKNNNLSGTLSNCSCLSGTLSFCVDDLIYRSAIESGFIGYKSDLVDLNISALESYFYLSDESDNYLTDEQENILFIR